MNKIIAKIAWQGDILRFGHFTNASGGTFPLLPDPRWLFTNPEYLKIIAEELSKFIKEKLPNVNTVAGASTAGIPLATAVSLQTGLKMIYVRKEGKGYSSNQTVEGKLDKNMVAVILDDFNVKGKGKNVHIQNLWANGVSCSDALTVFDCECEMVPWFADNNIKVNWLLTVSEYFKYGLDNNYISKELYDLVWDVYKNDNFMNWNPKQDKWKQIMSLAKKEGFKFLGE
ncbi:MAG: orotate phosphoribosyltransferase [Patescibacteria group bacterium]